MLFRSLGGDGFTPSVKVQTLPASEDTWSAHTCPQRTRVTPQQAGGRNGPHRQTPLLQLHPGMLPGSPGVASCRLTGQSLRGVRASHLLDSPGSRTLQSQTLSWGSARRGTGRLGEHGLQGLWGLPGQPRGVRVRASNPDSVRLCWNAGYSVLRSAHPDGPSR